MRKKANEPHNRSKGRANWTVENFAERIFVSCPRVFSFSHRVLTSLRHPYLTVVVDFVDSSSYTQKSRLEELLGALIESVDEERKWTRVATMFDTKLTAEHVDALRRKISLHPRIQLCVESLWAGLGDVSAGILREDEYKSFHYRLYSYLLKIDDVSVITSTSTAVSEDFFYDKRGTAGVDFASFALSMLELADNWTRTRNPEEYICFLKDIHDRCIKTKHQQPPRPNTLIAYSSPVYFAGGIVCQVKEGEHVAYVRRCI